MTRASSAAFLSIVVASAHSAGAQPLFRPLGVPEGFHSSSVRAVSADGRTLVGSCTIGSSPHTYATRWDRDTGQVEFLHPVLTDAEATAVSADGSVIVGQLWGLSPTGSLPLLWRSSGATVIPTPDSAQVWVPTGISDDGTTVVGYGAKCRSCPPDRGFWTRAGTASSFPPLPGDVGGAAFGISHDGTFATGSSIRPSGSLTAVLWRVGGNPDASSPLGWTGTTAMATSGNGRVVVGIALDPVNAGRMFRWDRGRGAVELLPDLVAYTSGTRQLAISDDGSVIALAGISNSSPSHPFVAAVVWTAAAGFRNLDDLLNGAGETTHWFLGAGGIAVSRDGRTIAGTGVNLEDAHAEGWVATLPPEQVCYANCDVSTTPPALNVADFSCFLQRFALGDDYANCDQSTAPPVLNVADFACFLQKFAARCG